MNTFVHLKLGTCGLPTKTNKNKEREFLRLIDPLLQSYQEQQHLLMDLGGGLCPADQRIQDFLDQYLADVGETIPRIPSRQLKLDRHGLAKMLSLPRGEDLFQNSILTSYRVGQVKSMVVFFCLCTNLHDLEMLEHNSL